MPPCIRFLDPPVPLYPAGMLLNTDNGAPIIPIDEQDMQADVGGSSAPQIISPVVPQSTLQSASSAPSLAPLSAASPSSMLTSVNGSSSDGSSSSRTGSGNGCSSSSQSPPAACMHGVFQGGWYLDLHKMLAVRSGAILSCLDFCLVLSSFFLFTCGAGAVSCCSSGMHASCACLT